MSSNNRPRSRRTKRILIGTAIGVGFLAIAVWSLARRGVTIGDVMERFSDTHLGWIAVYFGIQLVLQTLRVVRWSTLVRGQGAVPWKRTVAVGLVGQMAIILFPMRIGEAARPILISREDEIDFGQGTATVVVERVVDGILVGLMFIGTLAALTTIAVPSEFRAGAWAFTLIFGGVAVFILVAGLLRNWVGWLINQTVGKILPGFCGWLLNTVDSFFAALKTMARQPGRVFAFLGMTLVLWGITGLSLLPIFWAFDLDLPVVASFAVLCTMTVGIAVPAGPGGAGPLNFAVILAFRAFGVDEATNGALAILLPVLIIAVNVFGGLVGLWLGGISLKGALEEGEGHENAV